MLSPKEETGHVKIAALPRIGKDILKRLALGAAGGVATGAAGYGTGRMIGASENKRLVGAFNDFNKKENQLIVSRASAIGQRKAIAASHIAYSRGQEDIINRIRSMQSQSKASK